MRVERAWQLHSEAFPRMEHYCPLHAAAGTPNASPNATHAAASNADSHVGLLGLCIGRLIRLRAPES